MSREEVAYFSKQMDQLILLSGEVNLTIAKANAADDVKRMNNLSLWLTLVFAFEGFVQQVYRGLGFTERELENRPKDEPIIIAMLKVLNEKKGLDLQWPLEPMDKVLRRHVLLRNKWAHNLGIVEHIGCELAKISSCAGPGNQAWPIDRGWSELKCVVDELTKRIVGLK